MSEPAKQQDNLLATECRNVRIKPNSKAFAAVQSARATDPRFALLPSQRRRRRRRGAPPLLPAHPTLTYSVCFGAQLDERIVLQLRKLFAEQFERIRSVPAADESRAERARRVDARGYIYCFHDIGDPVDVLKIGRTRRTPEQRLREWERELAPEPGKSLYLLFAYRTDHNQFAERVINLVLRCENLSKRINALTGDDLDEFYRINNMMALAVFVRETIAFVDRWWRITARVSQPLAAARA